MKKIILGTLLAILLFSSAQAENGITNSFQSSIYAARTLGMGQAYTALSNDGEGIFSNPAGLADIKFPQFMATTKRVILNTASYTIWSTAVPTSWGTMGMGYAGSLIEDSFPTIRDSVTNRVQIAPSAEAMNYDNNVIFFSYSHYLPGRNDLAIGSNLKLSSQRLNTGTVGLDYATATNLDLSLVYYPLNYLTLGLCAENILGTSLNWSGASDALPSIFKIGLAVKLLGSTQEALFPYAQNLLVTSDFDLPYAAAGEEEHFHLGLEWEPQNNLFLRSGLSQRADGMVPSLGVGFKLAAFRFDYAYAPIPGIIGESPHFFSLAYVGDRTKDSKLKELRIEPAVKFIAPVNHLITSHALIQVIAEPQANRIYEERNIWTVPLIESSYEAHEIKRPAPLANLALNNYPVKDRSTIESYVLLDYGRNLINVSGLVQPENILVTDEVTVLRIKPLSDVPSDYWANESIALNSVLGLMTGYPDDSFKPEKGITRAELTAILVRASGMNQEQLNAAAAESKFYDVTGKWYKPYINLGVEMGLIAGYPDKSFKPDQILNRAEGVALIARFARIISIEGKLPFTDLEPGFWANRSILAAYQTGLLKYLEGKDFEPQRFLSRAEAGEILYRTSDIQRQVGDYWDYGLINNF